MKAVRGVYIQYDSDEEVMNMVVKRKQYCDGDPCGKGAASMRLTQSSPCSLCTADCRTLATHVAKIRDYCRTLGSQNALGLAQHI